MAKYAHPDDTAAWLTANGINIDRIPVDSDLTISTDDEGQRTIHYEELACDSFGHVVAFGGGTRTVRRSAPLTVEPPSWWRPYEKPTREQLLAGEEPYVDEHTEATPAQWIWLWNRATPERQLEVAKDIRAHAALADRCFMGNHERRLDQQQARLTRLDQQQARLTRLEAEREQAEDLLRVAHETSNRSEAERARAVQRAERAEEQRDRLAATLNDVLRSFVHKGHPGEPCLQTGWIAEKTVAKWRAVLYPPATEEQT